MWEEALSIRMTTELPTVTCRDESKPFEHPRGVSIYMKVHVICKQRIQIHMDMCCIPSLFQKLHFGDSTPPGLGLVV